LLRVIAGLETPQYGHIKYGDEIWFDSKQRVNLRPQRRHTGLLFQDYALFSHMNVAHNIGYGLPRSTKGKIVQSWLQRFGLMPFAQRRPRQLSGGQRQRVALARALAAEPKVILLDEPFSAVDATLRAQLRELLATVVTSLRRPVLLVTHDLDDVRYLATRLGVMINGQLVRFGPTASVFSDPGSRETAKVLGWRNFLPVNGFTGVEINADWGGIKLLEPPSPDTQWLGIRPEYIHISRRGEPGFLSRVITITEHGATREMTCQLQDGSMLYVHRPWNEPLPCVGNQLRLVLPPQHIVPLGDISVHKPFRNCARRGVSQLNFAQAV
jgi:molybdate transport system ATP-binding protein